VAYFGGRGATSPKCKLAHPLMFLEREWSSLAGKRRLEPHPERSCRETVESGTAIGRCGFG